jgi:hypothetical protein
MTTLLSATATSLCIKRIASLRADAFSRHAMGSHLNKIGMWRAATVKHDEAIALDAMADAIERDLQLIIGQ